MHKSPTKGDIAVICIILGSLFAIKNFHEQSQKDIKKVCLWITKNGGSYVESDHYWQKFLPDFVNKTVTGKVVSVDLSYAFLEDLTPLQNLQHIKTLSLDHVAIQNTTGLEKLTSLESLSLSHLSKDFIPQLSQLKNLIELNLSHSSIESLPNLENLSKLKYLNISNASYLSKKDISKQLNGQNTQIFSKKK